MRVLTAMSAINVHRLKRVSEEATIQSSLYAHVVTTPVFTLNRIRVRIV